MTIPSPANLILALLVAGWIGVGAPTSADAAEVDATQAALASELQVSAIQAMTEGDWTAAEERARAAISLDESVRTSQARLVLARALEQRGATAEAIEELDLLLTLDLLPRHREKAEEIRARLVEAGPDSPRGLHTKGTRGVGPGPAATAPPGLPPLDLRGRRILAAGLIGGGAVPAGLGITFIGFDASFASRGIESGGWAILGTSLLATGVVMEVIGVHVLVEAGKNPGGSAARRLRWVPTAAASVDRNGDPTLRLGVFARW